VYSSTVSSLGKVVVLEVVDDATMEEVEVVALEVLLEVELLEVELLEVLGPADVEAK